MNKKFYNQWKIKNFHVLKQTIIIKYTIKDIKLTGYFNKNKRKRNNNYWNKNKELKVNHFSAKLSVHHKETTGSQYKDGREKLMIS